MSWLQMCHVRGGWYDQMFISWVFKNKNKFKKIMTFYFIFVIEKMQINKYNIRKTQKKCTA